MAVEPQVQTGPPPGAATSRAGRSGLAALPWWQGWPPLVLLPAAVTLAVPPTWPRWAYMWALAFAIYAGCKWLTWRRSPVQGVPAWMHAGYLIGWPGLDVAAFLKPRQDFPPPRPGVTEWLFAGSKLALGVTLLFGVARLIPRQYPYLFGWVGMVGLILVLHFGSFHLFSCVWRRVGVEAKPLMNWPLASASVSEFWGRRWNTAFRDLTHRFLFRPLSTRLGARWAISAGFFFSGVVHDLVISLPSGGGYGGPSLFFALQGVAIFVERSRLGRQIGLGQGWPGWLFTMVVLVAPLYGLFHPPFVLEIVVPFLRALGAV